MGGEGGVDYKGNIKGYLKRYLKRHLNGYIIYTSIYCKIYSKNIQAPFGKCISSWRRICIFFISA